MTHQTTMDAALDGIADLAGIALRKRGDFKDAAFFILAFSEWSEKQYRYTPRDRKALRAIAKAALALDAALHQRTPWVENALRSEWLLRTDVKRPKPDSTASARTTFSQWLASPRILADLAGRAHGREISRAHRGKRGAPRGFRNHAVYEIATGLHKAASEYGGKLTIDKTLGTGSLPAALGLCKPFFASGFRIPSAVTLARMIRRNSAAPSPAKRRGSKKQKSSAKKPNS